MTTPIPGLRHLRRLGVTRRTATEYRRLLAAGVSPPVAAVLAPRAPRRPTATPPVADCATVPEQEEAPAGAGTPPGPWTTGQESTA